MNPHHPLADGDEEDIGEPEEPSEQRHVHVVVVTIVDKSSVSVFQEDRPTDRKIYPKHTFWVY